jgi:hypothetical protein
VLAAKLEGNADQIAKVYEMEEAIDTLKTDAEELKQKAKEFEELKKKAKSALLGAHKTGELESLALEMEATQKEMEEKAARIKDTKSKFSKNLISAHRTGELQSVFDTFDGTVQDAENLAAQAALEVAQTEEAVQLTTFATKQKARKSLINGLRSGELEMIAIDMPGNSPKRNNRRKKEPIDFQARNFNGADIYSYYSDQDTMPKYMKQGAQRSVPSKLRDALLTAEEYPFLLGKRGATKSPGNKDDASPEFKSFFNRNPSFKY